MTDDQASGEASHLENETVGADQSKRFRFKRRERTDGLDGENAEPSKKRHRHYHSSRSHDRKRHRTSDHLADDPSIYDSSVRDLPPDQAFRESLFDALGDDEGASFWQGVYGQPIHNYPNTYVDEQTGEVNTLNDEEYAQYVRRKMWEKSWEGIEIMKEEKRKEREREKQHMREEEKHQRKQEQTKSSTDEPKMNFLFDLEIDASLRRGQRRKDKKKWQDMWNDYVQRWEDLQNLAKNRTASEENAQQLFLRNKIAWPVESGKRKDVNADEIERFLRETSAHTEADNNDLRKSLMAMLKAERVRWHPDKIQQRYGFMQLDDSTMQGVTAVFQVLDKMWKNHEQRQPT